MLVSADPYHTLGIPTTCKNYTNHLLDFPQSQSTPGYHHVQAEPYQSHTQQTRGVVLLLGPLL